MSDSAKPELGALPLLHPKGAVSLRLAQLRAELGARERLTRKALMAALPLVMLAVSPERPVLSYAISLGWLGLALFTGRPQRADVAPFIYCIAAGAYLGLAALLANLTGSLTSNQAENGAFKAVYFAGAVLPLSLGVSLIVDSADDFKPTALVLVIIGILLALPTLLLHDTKLLGDARYGWQGNLLVLAALLLLQLWTVRSAWFAGGLSVLCLAAATLTYSRQSLLAALAGLVVSAAFWLAVQVARRRVGSSAGPGGQLILTFAILVAGGAGLAGWLGLSVLRAHGVDPLPQVPDPATCNCAATRVRELLFFNREALLGGDHSRVRLLQLGWQTFTSHPVLGAGLGSLDGLVRGVQDGGAVLVYRYPHNVWLELAAEVGIVGLLIVALPVFVGALLLFKRGHREQSPAAAGLLVVITTFAVVASVSGDLPSARTLWIFALPALKLGLLPIWGRRSSHRSISIPA